MTEASSLNRHGSKAMGALTRKPLLTTVATALVVAVGCDNRTADTLKIWAVLSVTGARAETGAAQLEGITLAAEEINEFGGVRGRPLRIVFRDAGGDRGRVERGVLGMDDTIWPVVLGGEDNVVTSALLSAVGDSTLVVSASSGSEQLDPSQGPLVRLCASQEAQVEVLVQRTLAKGFQKVAIVEINDLEDLGVASLFMERFGAAGGTVTQLKRVGENRPEYVSSLAPLIAGGAEAILLDANPGDAAQIIAEFIINFAGSRVFWLFTDRLQSESLVAEIGARNFGLAHEGIGPALPLSASHERFRAAYEVRFGSAPEPGSYAAQAYDATFLAALAIESAAAQERDALRAALLAASTGGQEYGPAAFAAAREAAGAGEDIDYQGVSGPVDLAPAGEIAPSFDIWRVESDGIRIVERAVQP